MQLIAEAYDLLRQAPGRLARRRSADVFARLERGRPGVVPHRDHRGRPRPHGRRDGQGLRRRRRGPGRAEGHRALDRADRPRPWRAGHRHRRGDLRPRPVRLGPPARGRPGSCPATPAAGTSPTATASSRTCAWRCTPRRSSPTPRASTRSPPPRREYGWDIDRGAMARIWRGGCIIRARSWTASPRPTSATPDLPLLLADPYFADAVGDGRGRLAADRGAGRARRCARARRSPPPSPTTTAARRTAACRAVQAQRDFFGAHTYRRVDNDGTFHTLWSADRREVDA